MNKSEGFPAWFSRSDDLTHVPIISLTILRVKVPIPWESFLLEMNLFLYYGSLKTI
jgi:hypothetical protein